MSAVFQPLASVGLCSKRSLLELVLPTSECLSRTFSQKVVKLLLARLVHILLLCEMMNSYFDHSSGFYNPAAAEAHQAAYRSFSQSLSLVPTTPQSAYQPASRTNSSSTDSSTNYVDAACKLYDANSLPSSQPSQAAGSKDQNGFKAPDQMTAWNTAASLRPNPGSASMSGVTGGFDASRSMSDAWSACCQTSAGGPSATSSSFYPWMAIAGQSSSACTLVIVWMARTTRSQARLSIRKSG